MKCPWVRAIAYFDRYLSSLPESERAQGREVRLRAPLESLGLPGELALDRDVVTTFAPLADPQGLEHGVSIGWTPVGSAALPVFRGSLRIKADSHKSSVVELEGEYEPPLGAVGKVFDAAIGRRIAEATGDELLKTIADRIELDYATEEPHISR
jgi:hypothetical protein